MSEQNINLSLQETEQLCRLYMECRLTVLEETELQYVLGKLPYSSPCIDEVRMLMGLTIPAEDLKVNKKSFGFFRNRKAVGFAASVAILLGIGITLVHKQFSPSDPSSLNDDSPVYIAAYNYGERLNGEEAVNSTIIAMAKADSLMEYACLTERDYMVKAGDIMSVSIDN